MIASLEINQHMSQFYRFTICLLICSFSVSNIAAETKSSKALQFEWTKVRGSAQDIDISANGEVFVVGEDNIVWRWRREGSGWSRRSGNIQRIAVDSKGSHWGVTEDGRIYRMSGLWWRQVDGLAQDIAIGGDGTIIKINQDDTLSRWDKFSGRWKPIPGSGKRIAVDPKGNPWVVKSDGTLARYDGREWHVLPGQAIDIAVGSEGIAFIIDADGIRQWDKKEGVWLDVPDTTGGIAISVGMGDKPWYVDTTGAIYASSLFPIDDEETDTAEVDSGTFIEPETKAADAEEILAIRRSNSAVNDPATITSDEPIVFEKVKGTAIDLAIGAEGSVFALQSDSVLSRWSNERSRFQNFPGTLIRIAVGPDGFPLGINTNRDIFRHDGKDWKNIKGKAEDIAVGADGTVIISDAEEKLYKLNSTMTRFELISGKKGDKIAVAPDGSPWVIRKDGSIFRCDTDPCTRLKRKGRDIAIGPDGSVFMLSTRNQLFIFDETEDNWQRILISQNPIAIAVGPEGRPWFADTKNNVFASTFFERDESNDQIIARTTNKPTVVSSSLIPTSSTSAFTFTKRLNFQQIPILTASTDNIGIGIDGSVLIVATSGFEILRYKKKSKAFELILSPAGGSFSITSDLEGRIWMITSTEVLFQKKKDGSSFTSYSLPATGPFQIPDIAIGGDGSVFAVMRPGDLFKFNPSKKKFEKFINTGSYTHVAVTLDGRPWVIEKTTNLVKEFDGSKFVKPGGITKTADDIGIGAGGTVYIVDATTDKLNKWNVTNKSFDKVDKEATHVSVDPEGRPWYLNTSGSPNAFRAK